MKECIIKVDRIDWHEKWLLHAKVASLRSMDARTKCGCVLVKDNQLISEGYNSFIRGIDDTVLPNFEGNDDPILSKYTYMSHAERSAITNAARRGVSTLDCIAYITTHPCSTCWQEMWQAGIKQIIIPDNMVLAECVKHDLDIIEKLSKLTQNKLEIIKYKTKYTINEEKQ